MKEHKIEYLVDTDVFVSHLTFHSGGDNSPLELALCEGICFTSALNIAELYYNLVNPEMKTEIDRVSKVVKVLGLPARYSLSIHKFKYQVNSVRDALFCVVAAVNKLAILTIDTDRYSNTGLKIKSINELKDKL